MRVVACLVVFPALAFSQINGARLAAFSDPPQVTALPFNPTNGFGISAAYWWSANYAVPVTNANVLTVANLTALGHGYDVTNQQAASKWPVRTIGALNGLDTLSFVASGSNLRNVIVTNTPGSEVFYIGAMTNVGSVYLFGSPTAGANQNCFFNGTAFALNCGSVASITSSGTIITNTWFVMDAVFNPSGNCTGYTNNVQTGSANAGNQGLWGMTLCCNGGLTSVNAQSWAETFVFTNLPVGGLTSLQRSNAYYYCTNIIAGHRP